MEFVNCKIRISLSVKLPLFFLCQGFILKGHFTSGENLITADRRLDSSSSTGRQEEEEEEECQGSNKII